MTDTSPIERLLIVQTGFLGDAVLAGGLLRAARALLPQARLGMMVRAGVAEIYEDHPALFWLHALDKRARGASAAMTREIAGVEYDAALIPHRSLRSTVIVRRAGIAQRVGFSVSDGALLLSTRVAYRIGWHETQRNAALLEALLDRPSDPVDWRSWLVPDASTCARLRERFDLDAATRLVLLAPGSVWATKRWKESGFVDVARALQGAGVRAIVIGSGEDRELCSRIATAAGLDEDSVLAGKLTLRELVALSSLAERVVTNDSAPLHIAEGVGTPVTAVFGPTVPDFGFGPLLAGSVSLGTDGLECRPCRIHGSVKCPIGTHECMERIESEQVAATIL